MGTMADFIFLGSKITADGDCSHEIKRHLLLGRKAMTNRQHIQKQRHYFSNKGPPSQDYGFSSSHVWMWELDYKESWAQKNWCFWTAVLKKTLESPRDSARRSNQSILKKISPGCSLEGLMLKLKLQLLWPPHAKSWLIWKDPDAGKDWGQEEKVTTEDEMVGWHHQFNGDGFGWTLGVGDGQGGLACCCPWDRRVRHDWATELTCHCVSAIVALSITLFSFHCSCVLPGFQCRSYWFVGFSLCSHPPTTNRPSTVLGIITAEYSTKSCLQRKKIDGGPFTSHR